MMPRIFDTEFSVNEIFGREIPTVSTVVRDRQAGGGLRHDQPCAGLRAAPARDPGLARSPRRGVRLRRPRAPPGGDPNAAADRPRAGVADLGQQPRPAPGRADTGPAPPRPDPAQRPSVHRMWLLRSGLSLQSQAHAAQHGPAHGGAARRAGAGQLPGGRAAPRAASRRWPRRAHAAGDRGRRVPDGLARQATGSASRSGLDAWCWPPGRSRHRASSCRAACRACDPSRGPSVRWGSASRPMPPSPSAPTSTRPSIHPPPRRPWATS